MPLTEVRFGDLSSRLQIIERGANKADRVPTFPMPPQSVEPIRFQAAAKCYSEAGCSKGTRLNYNA